MPSEMQMKTAGEIRPRPLTPPRPPRALQPRSPGRGLETPARGSQPGSPPRTTAGPAPPSRGFPACWSWEILRTEVGTSPGNSEDQTGRPALRGDSDACAARRPVGDGGAPGPGRPPAAGHPSRAGRRLPVPGRDRASHPPRSRVGPRADSGCGPGERPAPTPAPLGGGQAGETGPLGDLCPVACVAEPSPLPSLPSRPPPAAGGKACLCGPFSSLLPRPHTTPSLAAPSARKRQPSPPPPQPTARGFSSFCPRSLPSAITITVSSSTLNTPISKTHRPWACPSPSPWRAGAHPPTGAPGHPARTFSPDSTQRPLLALPEAHPSALNPHGLAPGDTCEAMGACAPTPCGPALCLPQEAHRG